MALSKNTQTNKQTKNCGPAVIVLSHLKYINNQVLANFHFELYRE